MREKQNFLINFAGFSNECVKNCPEDEVTSLQNIGRSIFLTSIFSFVSALFFLKSTGIANKSLYIVLFSLLWAFAIFSIDRFSVSIINYADKPLVKFFKSLPRLILSVCISVLIAAPIHVGLFSGDINEKVEQQRRDKAQETINKLEKQKDKIEKTYQRTISTLRETEINSGTNTEYNELTEKRNKADAKLNDAALQLEEKCNPAILEKATINDMRYCKEKEVDKKKQEKTITELDTEIKNLIQNAKALDQSDLNNAKDRKEIALLELNNRRATFLIELNADLSIFEKEEILLDEASNNLILLIGISSLIFVFLIIDFYPVIAKLSNPTFSYDLCIRDKKDSYAFKRKLSNRIDRYTSFRSYNDAKTNIHDQDIWIFCSDVEKNIFMDIYKFYGDKIIDIAKEKISEWSSGFQKKPAKNSSGLEKKFYEYFNKAVHGKEFINEDPPMPLSIQFGFITLPMLLNITIILSAILLAVYISGGDIDYMENIMEIIVSLALLIEFFKLLITKIIMKPAK